MCNMVEPNCSWCGCPYCTEPSPDRAHLEGHNRFECLAEPESDRTFHPKDHLRQHIRQVHQKSVAADENLGWLLTLWERKTDTLPDAAVLYCGFSGRRFSTWKERLKYVGNHSKHGADPSAWWPHRANNEDVCHTETTSLLKGPVGS